MTGYVLEMLFASGWRRENTIHWRKVDAKRAMTRLLKDPIVRAVRLLAVTVDANAVESLEAEDA